MHCRLSHSLLSSFPLFYPDVLPCFLQPSKESLERPVGFVDKRKKSLQELPFDTKSLEIANRIRVFVFGLEPEQDDEEATNADEVLSSSRGVATATEDLSDQERAATVVPRPLQKGAGQAESKESGSEKASAKESSEQNASLNRMPSTLSISPPPGSPPNSKKKSVHRGWRLRYSWSFA